MFAWQCFAQGENVGFCVIPWCDTPKSQKYNLHITETLVLGKIYARIK